MLKYLILAVSCLFVFLLALLLSACEPTTYEPIDDADIDTPDTSTKPSDKDDNQREETDSTIILTLSEVNRWRESGCKCGDQFMPATEKLAWNTKLYDAALAHAKDMHTNNYFSHTSKNGDNIYHRLTHAGYITKDTDVITYGENIAFGNFDLETVVQKWLESPSHCTNMMRDSYREMAIARSGNYWVQVFGAKRD